MHEHPFNLLMNAQMVHTWAPC